MLSIGFKGGGELRHSGLSGPVILSLLASILLATAVPFYTFFILRKKLDIANAAAVAATYGSVSAVTFIAATSFLNELKIPF